MPSAVTLTPVSSFALMVEWEAPVNSGGRPVMTYRVVVNETGTSNTVFMDDVGSDVFSVILRPDNSDLNASTSYEYVGSGAPPKCGHFLGGVERVS